MNIPKVKAILKERINGLLLILFAVFIVSGLSLTSSRAADSLNPKNTDPSTETIASTSPTFEEPGDIGMQQENVENNSKPEENQGTEEEPAKPEEKTSEETDKKALAAATFKDISDHLDKYCHKSGSSNKKKCEDYCSETKKLSKKDESYDNLYEKYCKIETTIVIKNKDGKTIAKYNNYRYTSDKDMTVFDFMKQASQEEKFSFKYETYSFGAYIYEINGVGTKEYNGYYWRLSINGKSSNVGASQCEVSDGDKIEWEYTDEY